MIEEALALHRAGQLAGARRVCRAILEKEPGHADALRLMATLELQRGNLADATSFVARAFGVDARSSAAQAALGDLQRSLGRAGDALASYDRSLAIDASQPAVHNERAIVLAGLGRHAEALAAFDGAIALRPRFAEALRNRATLLRELARVAYAEGRYDEAIARYGVAIASDPRDADALIGRGSVLALVKRSDEAARDFACAMAIDPERPGLAGLLHHAKASLCDWEGRDASKARIIDGARAGKPIAAPLVMLGISDRARDQLDCARAWSSQAPALPPRWRGERYAHSRIRIAYLSSDLDEHAVAYLMAGVLEHHDRSRFEVFAISSGPDPEGGMRARLRRALEHFHDVRGRRDDEVAALVRALEIDIVVDLNGYTQGSRTGALAHRPAPVAVSYLGFPGTLGAAFVDYVIADRIVVPEVAHAQLTEHVVRLPDTFQANDDRRVIATRSPSRAEAGLPDGAFVFCAFGNSYKLSPALFDVWMRLLGRVEASVLWLLGGPPALTTNLRAEAARRGIDGRRLVFASRMPYADHLARYRCADLFLDTFPFNGGATVSDALWAGLPVVSVSGEALASRMAASVLHAAGTGELAAASLADYESRALALATDPPRLAATRAALAQQRATCPLFDTARFCRHLESAYATMHARAQRGEAPASFDVSTSSGP